MKEDYNYFNNFIDSTDDLLLLICLDDLLMKIESQVMFDTWVENVYIDYKQCRKLINKCQKKIKLLEQSRGEVR